MTKFNRQWLAQRPYLLAVLISLLLVLWMLSGATQTKAEASAHEKKAVAIAKVQVTPMQAESIHNSVQLYGRTEPDRVVTLKAEVRGKIVAVLAERGALVKQGQVIAKIAVNDLDAQLASEQALLQQREIAFQGAQQLNQKGYQGQAELAQANANLQMVKANIARLQLDLAHTVITAPFDGVLNTRYVEQGDYVAAGDNIAMLADLDPIVIRAYATEQQISELAVGQSAKVQLLNGHQGQGTLRYLASVADEHTNTFKVEVALVNTNYHQVAGLSGELDIPLQTVSAIKISPALLALDELGNIGVKSVQNQHVVFTPINIVKSESDGVWLTGLGEQADIITLGQGFVRAGDPVDAVTSAK